MRCSKWAGSSFKGPGSYETQIPVYQKFGRQILTLHRVPPLLNRRRRHLRLHPSTASVYCLTHVPRSYSVVAFTCSFCRSSEFVEKMASLPKLVASNGRVFWGWFFLIIGSFSFVGFLYAAVISKLLPPSNNHVIRAIQNDWYYCFLVPLTLPILLVAVYFHWLSMKLFKHA